MPENSKTAGENQHSRWTWPKLAAAAAIVLVYFFGLTIPLVGPDEPRYAQVAREMYERSDWITPTLGGFNWFEKPAMLPCAPACFISAGISSPAGSCSAPV